MSEAGDRLRELAKTWVPARIADGTGTEPGGGYFPDAGKLEIMAAALREGARMITSQVDTYERLSSAYGTSRVDAAKILLHLADELEGRHDAI